MQDNLIDYFAADIGKLNIKSKAFYVYMEPTTEFIEKKRRHGAMHLGL